MSIRDDDIIEPDDGIAGPAAEDEARIVEDEPRIVEDDRPRPQPQGVAQAGPPGPAPGRPAGGPARIPRWIGSAVVAVVFLGIVVFNAIPRYREEKTVKETIQPDHHHQLSFTMKEKKRLKVEVDIQGEMTFMVMTNQQYDKWMEVGDLETARAVKPLRIEAGMSGKKTFDDIPLDTRAYAIVVANYGTEPAKVTYKVFMK